MLHRTQFAKSSQEETKAGQQQLYDLLNNHMLCSVVINYPVACLPVLNLVYSLVVLKPVLLYSAVYCCP